MKIDPREFRVEAGEKVRLENYAAARAWTSRSKASARLTLSRFIIRSPWPA